MTLALETYLPHRPPMLLIDELVELGDTRAVCRAQIKPDCVFAIAGVVHPAALIEFMAQACATLIGPRAGADGPRPGVIVSCRQIDFFSDELRIGDQLELVADRLAGETVLATFECKVTRGGELVAAMQLSVAEANALGLAP
jgi:predicted hotdog family 3-hydroxylacyl-ACP dehydratase